MATMTVTTTIHEMDEHDGDLVEEIDFNAETIPVNFYPPLFLQRRIWILDILRRESIGDVCTFDSAEVFFLLRILLGSRYWLRRGSVAQCSRPACAMARSAACIRLPGRSQHRGIQERHAESPRAAHRGARYFC